MKYFLLLLIPSLLVNSCKTSQPATNNNLVSSKQLEISCEDSLECVTTISTPDTLHYVSKIDSTITSIPNPKSTRDSIGVKSLEAKKETKSIKTPLKNINKDSAMVCKPYIPVKNSKSKVDKNTQYLGFKAERIIYKGKSYDVVIVDTRKNNVRILFSNADGRITYFNGYKEFNEPILTLSNVAKHMPDHNLIMNGGMYSYDGGSIIEFMKPLGLCIENKTQISAIDTCKNKFGNFYMQPNGIFLLDMNSIPHIIVTNAYNKYKSNVRYATQSGPMLVINSKLNPLFKEGSVNTNIRNGVGLRDNYTLVLAISNVSVNFYDFASLFRDKYRCEEALYLDGAISGAIIPNLKRDDSKKGNNYAVFIGVEPKKGGEK